MFTSGLKECEMSRVRLQGVCPSAMAWLVYFMYTGKVRVTELTVCQLLPAATMFQVRKNRPRAAVRVNRAGRYPSARAAKLQIIVYYKTTVGPKRYRCVYVMIRVVIISNVIEACCAFLERQLDPSNAIGIANFAEQHGCTELKQKANQFIERHFTQVCREEEFLQLTPSELIALIRKDELNVREETEVYNAVISWVKHDEERRRPRMEHILQAVRCQYLSPSFLKEQMRNCTVLRKVPACREYLARIFQDLTLHKKPVVKERRPNTPRIIYVAGGYMRHSIDTLEAFNLDDNCWSTLPRLTVPRSGLGAAFLKGVFYAVGGRNNSPGSSYDSDWVDVYNPASEQWRPCSPMSTPRNRVGVAVMDGLLYAVGGSAGSEYHKSVECYDPETDIWSSISPMGVARLGVGVAVVNRLLYAVGGFDGARRLRSVECYHPENNRWTEVASMNTPRSGAGVVALNQFIYVVGGYDGAQQLASVERYDTERDVWEQVASVRVARSALSLTVLDNKLYAMGGYDGTSFLDIVEVYDPATDEWRDGTPLTSGRSGHASAVCYQHVTPLAADHVAEPAFIKKIGKRAGGGGSGRGSGPGGGASNRGSEPGGAADAPGPSRSDDIPMANNIIGTLSSHRPAAL
ncbi:Kelch-like ECH-associated protein 1 [Eumeta japonica]|uniref:Kelch-like ECH-associated protein 1 n=1 Tax=Eumeta variegata TaxID=151549 RepID=A0A4C1USP8_EUMVA|nr:Kelch-like ECH-associated protein 1 [Eumeta japonica]